MRAKLRIQFIILNYESINIESYTIKMHLSKLSLSDRAQ